MEFDCNSLRIRELIYGLFDSDVINNGLKNKCDNDVVAHRK